MRPDDRTVPPIPLPVLSALVVTLLGFWLCYDAIHSQPPPGQAAGLSVREPMTRRP